MNDPNTRRRRRRKEARPTEIWAAALACFAERGFAATRLEDVAARAGVTKGTVYLYYRNKEELFKAVVRGALLPNLERFEAAITDDVPASALVKRFLAFWAEHIAPSPLTAIPKLVLAEAGNFPDLARFYLDEVVHRGLRLIGSILRRGIERGEFRPVDVDHTVYCFIAPLLFSALWNHSLGRYDDRPLDIAALCRAHQDMLLHGLAPVGRPTAPDGARS